MMLARRVSIPGSATVHNKIEKRKSRVEGMRLVLCLSINPSITTFVKR